MGRLTYEKLCDILQHVNRVTFILDEIGEESYSSQEVHEAIKELQRYKDLEEHGRLIELPCAVGSRVYFILENDEIDNQLIDNVQTALFFKDLNGNLKKGFYRTKEEAERKLEELKGE